MAKFCQSSLFDAETVGLVTSLLAKSKRVMPKLEYQDKWPNIDGYVYFLEEPIEDHKDCSETLGTFEVQIKKLPSGHQRKFSFETDYLRYSENAINPVLLICVDIENEVLYWKHINKAFIDSYGKKINQGSITVELSDDDLISKDSQDYVDEWESIIINQRNKVQGYDLVREELNSYQQISEHSKLIPAKVSKNYVRIHEFLDILNNYLDKEFQIVKEIFLPSTWKLGFAFLKYEPEDLSYSLFNIPYNVNDVQIKQIVLTGDVQTFMREQGITSFTWSHENSIDQNPRNVAVDWIKNKVDELIKEKLLKVNSVEIMNDFLFEFVYHFSDALGLPKKNEYTVAQIRARFNEYFLIWVEELYKLKSIPLHSLVPIELDSGFNTPSDEEITTLKERVQERIQKSDYSTSQFVFSKKIYDFSKFFTYLEFFEKEKIEKVVSNYAEGSKEISAKAYMIWEKYTPQEITHNAHYLYSLLPKIHDELVYNNFPSLFDELCFFKGFNKLIVVLRNLKDDYSGDTRGPCVTQYYVVDESSDKNTFEFYTEDDFPYAEKGYSSLERDGVSYRQIGSRMGVHHDIFHRFPTLNYVYESIKEKLDAYFEKLTKGDQDVQ